MAVYVVLEFDDETEAHCMVREIVKGGLVMVPGKYPDESLAMGDAKVYGVWKKPTKYCECASAGKRDGGYTRGTTFGWWVHAPCGRPTKGWAHGDSWFTSLGTNLLPSQLHPEGAQFTNQPKSKAEWSFLLPERQNT